MNQFASLKPKPSQLEVQWLEPEAFALITQVTVDGERVTREAAQLAADKEASANQQSQLMRLPIQKPAV